MGRGLSRGLSPEAFHQREHEWANGYLPPYEDCWQCQRARAICKSKVVYDSFLIAYEDALRINIERDWGWQMLYPYWCRYCEHHHLHSARTDGAKKKVEQMRRKWIRGRVQTERPSEREPSQELERNPK